MIGGLALYLALLSSGQAAAPSGAPTRTTYVAYVSSADGKCVYQTGDVLFDQAGFETDLRQRFHPWNGMLIYHAANVSAACIKRAVAVAKRVGFKSVETGVAPENLDMGPPR